MNKIDSLSGLDQRLAGNTFVDAPKPWESFSGSTETPSGPWESFKKPWEGFGGSGELPNPDHVISDLASKLSPQGSSTEFFSKPQKTRSEALVEMEKKFALPEGTLEGSINQTEADHIVDKSRIIPTKIPGRYFLGPSKAEGLVQNVSAGFLGGIADVDPETLVGRIFGNTAAIADHQKKWYGVSGERSPGNPGENWYERWAYGFGRSLPSMMESAGLAGTAGALGSGVAATGALGALPFAVQSAAETTPQALAQNPGETGRAVSEGLANAGVTFAAFAFLGPLGKLFGKPVAEQVLGQSVLKSALQGGLGLGAAGFADHVGKKLTQELIRSDDGLTSDRVKEMLNDPEEWKQLGDAVAPLVLMGMGTGAFHAAISKIRPQDQIPGLVKANLVTPEEAVVTSSDPKITLDLAKARFDGNIAELKTQTNADGSESTIVDSRPDVLSYQNKKALGFNEAAIGLVRDNITSGKNTIEDVFPAQGEGKIKLRIDSTNLTPVDQLTDDLRLRNRIAQSQRRYVNEVLNLASDQNRLPIDQRIVLKNKIEADFNAKIERLLGQDDNTPKGAKAQIAKRVQEIIPAPEAPALSEQINSVIDELTKNTVNMTQRETVARVAEFFGDKPESGVLGSPENKAFTFLDDLYSRMVNDPKYQPWGENVKQGLESIDKISVTQGLRDIEGARTQLQDSIKKLPPEFAAPLLRQALELKTPEDITSLRDQTKFTMESYLRDGSSKKILKYARTGLEKSPRRAEGIRVLRNHLGEASVGSPEDLTVKLSKAEFSKEPWWEKARSQDKSDLVSEQNRLVVAKDPELFRKLSENHAQWEDKWKKLEEEGSLTKGDHGLLRFIFSDSEMIPPSNVATIPEESRNPGRYGPFRDVLEMRKLRGSPLEEHLTTFLHEYMHAAYYNFLDAQQLIDLQKIHQRLLDTPSKMGLKSAAHDIIAESSGETILNRSTSALKTIDYYARNPYEFFAETGSRFLQETKSPMPKGLRAILHSTVSYLYDLLRYMSGNKITKDIVPPEYLKSFEKVLKKDSTGPSGTTLVKLADTLGLGDKNLTFHFPSSKDNIVGVRGDKPTIFKSEATGADQIDFRELQKRLKDLPIDRLQNLQNDLARVVRQGQIERGLYKKWLKYSTAEDTQSTVQALGKLRDRPAIFQRIDRGLDISKYLTDPVSTEGRLWQMVRGNSKNPLYAIFHKNLVEPISQHYTNTAKAREFIGDMSKKILGINNSSSIGQYPLINYLSQRLPSGATRGEAMELYALLTDQGRRQAVEKSGAILRRDKTKVDQKALVAELAPRDKTFVDEVKKFYKGNPFIEKAFKSFVLQEGYEPYRRQGYFPSQRVVESEKLPEDFASYTTQLLGAVDTLKAVSENADQPFQVRDFLSTFYRSTDGLSLYGEVGRDIYRAERLAINNDFQKAYVDKAGKGELERLKLYLGNVYGRIGHQPTNLDHYISWALSNYTVSRVALNVASGAKQLLHIFTMLGDSTLDKGAIARSLAEGSALNSRVDSRMISGSGMAAMRYNGGKFIESMLLQAEEGNAPTKLDQLRQKSMVLQRTSDRAVMRVTWRAAELTAQKEGLSGPAAADRARQLFEIAAGRDQPTDNPLYASTIEIQAKRQPLVRAALVFMREQNRIYNVVRRQVVGAIQKPSAESFTKAGAALFFAVAANAAGVVGINAIRRTAFAKDTQSKDLLSDSISNLAGMWYLGKVAGETATTVFVPDQYQHPDSQSPVGALAADMKSLIEHTWKLSQASGVIESGVNRGESKSSHELGLALDSAFSATSGVLGLPFWALWYQGKGLYNWNRDSWRLLTRLETEKARLDKQPNLNAPRLLEIKRLKERINEIHGQRKKGFVSQENAQKSIVRMLKIDARE